MSNVLDIQCPNCKAPIKFDAKVGKMKCEYCGSEINAEDLKHAKVEDLENIKEKKVEGEYVKYTCPDCGAEIIADENTAATFCLYCGNTAILKQKLTGEFKPDYVIPFKSVKEDAINAFKGLRKGRPFVPDSFVSEKNIEKITGLYVPFWLYNFFIEGDVDAECTRSTRWSRGDMRYIKTDYFHVVRGGSMEYNKIPVDGSKKFEDDIMNTIEPFDYSELKDFTPAYLSGFLAEKYDISSDDVMKDAENRAIESSKQLFLNDMKTYESRIIKNSSLMSNSSSVEYALLPVWMVNVKYDGKYYLFAMNGQTKEFVGNIPLDKKKVVIWAIVIFVILLIIVLVIQYLLYLGTRG